MDYLAYILVIVVLLICELIYFRIADKYNIIDKPNQRSSHTSITLRGGGIVFAFSVFLYFAVKGNYPWFVLGTAIIAAISLIDDIKSLSGRIRITAHLLAVSAMFYQAQVLALPLWVIIAAYILVIGTINAYNFMDGINGITGAYSLSVLVPIYILNNYYKIFDTALIYYTAAGILVFLFFNFRVKAKCFAGDVGSVSLAFIVLFLLIQLILKTGELKYLLFLAVYGVETVLTIIQRLYLRENIFAAHRKHLYQYLSNELKWPHLTVAFLYTLIQTIINGYIVYTCVAMAWWEPLVILGFLGAVYIIAKLLVTKKLSAV